MCTQPKYIVNPAYVKSTGFGKFPFVHFPNYDFTYSRNAFDDFDYKRFSAKRNGINKDVLDKYYAYDLDGSVIPIYIEVPCGHCSSCVMHKVSDVRSKMLLEQSCYDFPPLFLTLTYDDANLPVDGVCIPDVQLFMKRFRSYLDYHYKLCPKFRYICFSEYGKTGTRRPHYHILIFGIECSPYDVLGLENDMRECWGKGFLYLKLCNAGAFNYVSKYICKGSNVPPGKNPNFRLSSRRNGGLGVPAFENESLYLTLMSSPHPTVNIKVLGKSMTVFVPKSIRERLCRSPRQFFNEKTRKTFKHFCFLSVLIKDLMDKHSVFRSHVNTLCKLENVLPPTDSLIVPKPIYDKFAGLEVAPIDVRVPYYMRNIKNVGPEFWKDLPDLPGVLTQYVKDYKYLEDFEIDFGKYFHFSYLRSKVYERWKLSLIQFVERNSDLDALSSSKFNAIQIEMNYERHPC